MRSFLSARAKRNSGIRYPYYQTLYKWALKTAEFFPSDCFQSDKGLKVKYLYALNDLSFTGITIKTSGVEIVDKQWNFFMCGD